MKREDLFLAIGAVEESRLARSELAVSGPSGACHKEEANMKKKGIYAGRIIRNVVAAVLIVSMLSVTAYAAVGYLIFDSPSEMLTSIFGDKTGYDHSEGSITHDPLGGPEAILVEPTFDRVPVDEDVMESEVAPLVSPVGQSISWGGYTLTVDANMYDQVTKCGVLTYTIENPDGIKPYVVQSTGEVYFPGGEIFDTNQYGYSYIIQDKCSDTKLTAVYYYQLRNPDATDLELTLSQWAIIDASDIERINEELLQQLKQEVSLDDAIEAFKQEAGQELYERCLAEMSAEEFENAVYFELVAEKFNELYTCPDKITIPEKALGEMSSITLADGNITISPIAMYVDITNMQDHPTGHIGTAKIRFKDGTEYVVYEGYTINYVFAVGNGDTNATFMFNRIVDVNEIASVVLDGGLEFTVN